MFKLKQPAFENVVAAQTATLSRFHLGSMYDGIALKMGGGNNAGNMTAIRLLINGKIAWNITGTHLDTWNKYKQITNNASYLLVPFSDFNAYGEVQSQIGALDTSQGVDTMSMEVDLGAGVAPTLAAYGFVSPPSPKGDTFANAFHAVLKKTQTPAAAGQIDMSGPLGSKTGAYLKSMLFFHANITSLAVKRDGVNLYDDIDVATLNYMSSIARRTTQAGLVVFDPADNNYPEDYLPTIRSDKTQATWEFLPTLNAGDTVTQYGSLVTTLDRI